MTAADRALARAVGLFVVGVVLSVVLPLLLGLLGYADASALAAFAAFLAGVGCTAGEPTRPMGIGLLLGCGSLLLGAVAQYE